MIPILSERVQQGKQIDRNDVGVVGTGFYFNLDGQGRSDKEHLSIQPFPYINAFNSQFFIIFHNFIFEILDREIMFWR